MILSYPYDIIENNIIKLRFPIITSDNDLPYISVLTITRNRTRFYPLLLRNLRTCDYPKHLIEWVIIEDGNSFFDVLTAKKETKIESITYRHLGETLHFPIGYKRNLAAKIASNNILVHIDDDDFYPPESILARVRCLNDNTIKCVGCLSVRTFHLFTERTYEAYESTDINMSESSLAYTRHFWEQRPFENKCSSAEGIAFVKGRYEYCKSLPHVFVIVQFDHAQNTTTRLSNDPIHDSSTVSFLRIVDRDTARFVLSLRDDIAMNLPETRILRTFIHQNNDSMKKASENLHTLPSSLQRHPLALQLCRNHRSNTNKNKNKTIVFYCYGGERINIHKTWDYDSLVGGSEEAVLNLAKYFIKKKNFHIHIYNERDNEQEYENGKIIFKPWYRFRPLNYMYAFISFRDPSHFDLFPEINAKYCFLDLHDLIPSSWIKGHFCRIDHIMVKSQFHATISTKQEMNSKVHVVPNGIPRKSNEHKKERFVLCTCSPERCWDSLFRLADDIPNIQFVHAYDFENVQKTNHWKKLQP